MHFFFALKQATHVIAVISFLPVALSMSTFPFARFDRPHRLLIFFKSRPKAGNGNWRPLRNGGGKGRLGKFGGIVKPGGGNAPGGGSIGKPKNGGMGGFAGELEFSFVSDGLPAHGVGIPFFQPVGGIGGGPTPSWPPGKGIIGAILGGNGGIIGGGKKQGCGAGAPFGARLSLMSKNCPPSSGGGSRSVLIGLNFDSDRFKSLLQSSANSFLFSEGSVCIGVSDSSDFVSKNRLSTIIWPV